MSFLDTIADKLFPPKPKRTQAQLREDYMIRKYRLTKDATEPFTYWINEDHIIRFNPEDEQSVENAMKQIDDYYSNPQIKTATRDQRIRREVLKPAKQSGTKRLNNDLAEFSAGIGDMTDYFTQEPKKEKK